MLKQNKLIALQNNHIIDPAYQRHQRLKKGTAKLHVHQDGPDYEKGHSTASLPLRLLNPSNPKPIDIS